MKVQLFILCCFLLIFALGTRNALSSEIQVQEPAVDGPEWDALRVRFGIPFLPLNFRMYPRTASGALATGFKKISSCDNSPSAKWRGDRYVKNSDYSLILLYDVNGYIAGTQTGVGSDMRPGYPPAGLRPPFVEDGPDRFVVTAYFVDPAIICDSGRSSADFQSQGTGTNLYFQRGENPESDSVLVPRQETGLSSTKWVKGGCFIGMGVHYWYDFKKDTPCDEISPGFLLYDKGFLIGFGWALMTNLPTYRLMEHTTNLVFPIFMKIIPRCLYTKFIVTSQHIYFVDEASKIRCSNQQQLTSIPVN